MVVITLCHCAYFTRARGPCQAVFGWARLNLNDSYNSGIYPELSRRGNVTRHYDNNGYFSFSYDSQNRLTNAYGQTYLYDSAGRLTDYEGAGYSSYDGHAILKSGYSYDANGNLISRAGRTLAWNHENRLQSVSGGGLPTESYLYDDNGIRVKKTTGSTNSYYPFAHYEISGSTTIKYYFPSMNSGQALVVNASP